MLIIAFILTFSTGEVVEVDIVRPHQAIVWRGPAVAGTPSCEDMAKHVLPLAVDAVAPEIAGRGLTLRSLTVRCEIEA